jgi:hypothetical protein
MVLGAVLLCLGGSAFAKTVYVNQNAPVGANDGTTWNNAYLQVAQGMDAASSGDEVWVARSTPAATDYREQITLKEGVALYGGFAGTETIISQRSWVANPTIIDANASGAAVTSSDTGATLDGFTLRNPDSGGAVISLPSGSTTIADCVIQKDQGDFGIEVQVGATGVVSRCKLLSTGSNTAVYNMGTTTVENCAISGWGNGVYSEDTGAVTVSNCTITRIDVGINTRGGTANISNCIVVGALYGIVLNGSFTLSHNDVWGGSYGNYGGVNPGNLSGSISADPLFVNSAGGDSHLLASSPCKDAGDDTAVIGTTDIAGNPRIKAAHVDMGAYEIGNRVYVNQNAPVGTNDGSSWNYAYLTVGQGITGAQGGDEVWVASGTYGEHVTVAKDLALYGGFAGTETSRDQRNWAANATVLSGGGSSEYVAQLTGADAVLDGFTVRDNAGHLAGLTVSGGTSSIANCTIAANSSGAQVLNGTATFTNCSISGNAGFGAYVDADGVANFTACTFNANAIAAIVGSNNSTANVSNCIVSGGEVGIVPDGITALVAITNSTLTDSTIAAVYEPAGTAIVSNCILASNAAGIMVESGTATLSHNNVWSTGDNYTGTSPDAYSISADPLFVNSAGGDYHLLAGSPCIDAGDDSAVAGTTDLDGNPRVSGNHVDLGATESFAYELATYPGRTLTSPTASADGIVYFGDSAGFLHAIDTTTRVAVFVTDTKVAAPANNSRKALGRLTRWNLDGTPRIFCVTSDNYLMVYGLDGVPVWTTQLGTTGTSVIGSAMVYNDGGNDFIYAATSDGTNTKVYKIDSAGTVVADTGTLFNGASSTSAVSVFGGSLFISTSGGSYCLQASDLTVRVGLSASGTAPPFIAATASSPVAIVVTTDGSVNAYSPYTGTPITTFGANGSVDLGIAVASGAKVTAAPFVYNAEIYVGGMDSKVYCLNLADGSPAGAGGTSILYDATTAGAGAITAGIGVCPYGTKTLVFGSTNANYFSVDLSGTPSVAIPTGSPISTAPAYDPTTHTICIAADNGNMYQFPGAMDN